MAKPFFKNRILTTGPTPIPEFVSASLAQGILYHRSPAFSEVMAEVRSRLPSVLGHKGEVLCFSGTGTAAMEGAICNFLNPGDKVLSVNAGKFGARWGEQARVYGCELTEIVVQRGQAVSVQAIAEALKKEPEFRAVLIHASETSTGVRHDVKSIAELCRSLPDCLCLVDGVTSMGVFEVPMDAWGIDVFVAGSQKGMMLPPGLSFGAASARAWERTRSIKNVRYYLDWRRELKAASENSGAFTSNVTLIVALREVLRYFDKEGLESIYDRHWKLCFATRRALRAAGAKLLVENDDHVAAGCTGIWIEGAVTSALRSQFGLTVSGGQDELKGKIVRLGHMGYFDAWDVSHQLLALAQLAPQFGQRWNSAAMMNDFFESLSSQEDFVPKDLKVRNP